MKYVILFIYIAINVLLFFFNWKLFTTVLEIDLGMGKYNVLPLLIIQIIGLLLMGVYMVWDRMKDLKREVLITNLKKRIVELQKNNEIQHLKEEVKESKKPYTITPSIEDSPQPA